MERFEVIFKVNGEVMSDILLEQLLKPLAEFYDHADVVEVRMSEPEKIIIERRNLDNRTSEQDAPRLTHFQLVKICRALANSKGLRFSEDEHPKVSTTLPDGHRFECLMGAASSGHLSLSIRCKHPHEISFANMGLDGEMVEYILNALDQQANIVISGGTNTGKTTLLNKLLSHLPEERRVVSVEDTPELDVSRFNDGVALFAARDASQGVGLQTWQQLYDHMMRISPESIIFGEISTQNAFNALNVLNTGARGWMCSVHADRPEMVSSRFQQNINASGETMDADFFMKQMVDLVIHITRDLSGKRRITDIWEMKNNIYIMKNGEILDREIAA